MDRGRIEQAMRNVVDNAVVHGNGSVHIEVIDRESTVELHVRDEGLGLDQRFLADAFARFSRGETGRTGGGAGLGLSIVQAIAHAHGGAAHAANGSAGGADVWIELPRPD